MYACQEAILPEYILYVFESTTEHQNLGPPLRSTSGNYLSFNFSGPLRVSGGALGVSVPTQLDRLWSIKSIFKLNKNKLAKGAVYVQVPVPVVGGL
jgi:hypothetical protein